MPIHLPINNHLWFSDRANNACFQFGNLLTSSQQPFKAQFCLKEISSPKSAQDEILCPNWLKVTTDTWRHWPDANQMAHHGQLLLFLRKIHNVEIIAVLVLDRQAPCCAIGLPGKTTTCTDMEHSSQHL